MATQGLQVPITVDVSTGNLLVGNDRHHGPHGKSWPIKRALARSFQACGHSPGRISQFFIKALHQGASHGIGTGDSDHDAG